MEKVLIGNGKITLPLGDGQRLIRDNGSYAIVDTSNTSEPYNKRELYIEDVNLIENLLENDCYAFPELKGGYTKLLTNDGILAFSNANTTIIYDLTTKNDIKFSDVSSDSANMEMLYQFDAELSQNTHYMIPIAANSNAFLPYRISDTKFYIDCEAVSLDGATELSPDANGYFDGNPTSITYIAIKRKLIYHFKQYGPGYCKLNFAASPNQVGNIMTWDNYGHESSTDAIPIQCNNAELNRRLSLDRHYQKWRFNGYRIMVGALLWKDYISIWIINTMQSRE